MTGTSSGSLHRPPAPRSRESSAKGLSDRPAGRGDTVDDAETVWHPPLLRAERTDEQLEKLADADAQANRPRQQPDQPA